MNNFKQLISKKTLLFFVGLFCMLSLQVYAQNINITGTVTDSDGQPLPGVTVVVKNTSNGTATDGNGAYSLSVANANVVLTFSYIGYTSQDITVGNRRNINVTLLEDTRLIDEVVVIGYGTVKKANLTGSVGYVDNTQLENRAVANVSQALQGKVAGLNINSTSGAPGAVQNINIRGYTGLGKMATPLLVIDGIQGGDLNSIEINDVESISFLKDAASSAIYGSSAPYGVILVTTKKGRIGKPVISYNNTLGWSRPTNLPHWANSLEFARIYNIAQKNTDGGFVISEETIDRMRRYQAGTYTYTDPKTGITYNNPETVPLTNTDDWQVRFDGNGNNDWFDIIFNKVAFSQRHNIGVSGATEASNYYVGLGYTQQDGLMTVGDEKDQRYNVRANVTTNLAKWLTFTLRTAYARSQQDMPAHYPGIYGGNVWDVNYSEQLFHSIGRSYPNWPYYQPDGTQAEFQYVIGFENGGRQKRTTDHASLSGEFVIKPLPGWEITANYTYASKNYEHTNHQKIFYVQRPSGALFPRASSSPNEFYRNMEKGQDFTINVFSNYQKQIGDHNINATLGFLQQLNTYVGVRGWKTNLISDQVPMLSLADGTTTLQDWAWEEASRGAFGRIQYNFKEKYLLEINGRYDGTSKFTKDKRMKFYPGVSAAWTISRESFWQPLTDYVNMFKLRASYANLGSQQNTGRYDFYPGLGRTIGASTEWLFAGNSREMSFRPPGLVNFNTTWVTVQTLDFGFDLGVLRNRLDVTFDWYTRKELDYIGPSQLYPALLGTGAPGENNTDVETKGWEISLGWKDRVGDFSYGISARLWDYQQTCLKYPNPDRLISRWYNGQKAGEIWGWETVGLIKTEEEAAQCRASQRLFHANWTIGDVHYKNKGDVLTRGKNTADDPGDQIVIGNVTPRYQYGLNLEAGWKGFDATLFLQGTGKRDLMFHYAANYFWGCTGWGSYQSAVFTVHDFWTEETPNGYLPRPSFTYKNTQPQTGYLQSGAYMRIKNFQIGYTIPKAVTDKIKFQKARLFVNAENLATFTKLVKIVDPEVVNTNYWDEYNSSSGKTYPVRQTWSFGVNVTF